MLAWFIFEVVCGGGLLTSCNSETSVKVVENSPDSSLELQRNPERLNASIEWDANDKVHVQPVDMLVPVLEGHFCVGNVHLFGVSSRPRPGICSGSRHAVLSVSISMSKAVKDNDSECD